MIRLPARAPDLNFLNQKTILNQKTFLISPSNQFRLPREKDKNFISNRRYLRFSSWFFAGDSYPPVFHLVILRRHRRKTMGISFSMPIERLFPGFSTGEKEFSGFSPGENPVPTVFPRLISVLSMAKNEMPQNQSKPY